MGLIDWLRSRFQGGPSQQQEASPANRDPKAIIVKPVGLNNSSGADSREFTPPEFDLSQITDAYNTEAYVRQAVDKYIELMFKSGWDLVGKNPDAVEYIRLRFASIAEATMIPTEQLFISCAEDLVKYSNVIIAKARQDNYPFPQGVKVQGVGGAKPVVGYFPLNVATMSVRRDKNGMVRGWQQEVEGHDNVVKFKPEDIIHIPYKRDKGYAFGTPFLLPVLDDIRALRQAEENVLRLMYRCLYPFFHYQVGNAQYPASQDEIDDLGNAIHNMDIEAGLITSERHKITPIAADKIIDAHPYLKYFEERVFTGLGVPATLLGRGNTVNRSTSDNMSTEFIDRVKAYQKVFASFIDEFMIKELLLEGGYDPIYNPEDDVDFVFREIDMDAKVKAENHAVFKYEHNAISEDEMRTLLGQDPIDDRSKMFMNVVTIPVAKATGKAVDNGNKETDNKNKPTNQHKTKPSPKKEEYPSAMLGIYSALESNVTDLIVLRHDDELTDELFSKKLSANMSYAEGQLLDLTRYYLSNDEFMETKKHIRQLIARTYEMVVEACSTIGTLNPLLATIDSTFSVLASRITFIAEDAYQTQKEERS